MSGRCDRALPPSAVRLPSGLGACGRVETTNVAEVDPSDDTRRRFIVWHYAYDPERNERRNIVVTAFDDATEFEAYVDRASSELRRRQRQEGVDAREHFGGVVKEAGDDARNVLSRELKWKFRRGTVTADDIAQARALGWVVARRTDPEPRY